MSASSSSSLAVAPGGSTPTALVNFGLPTFATPLALFNYLDTLSERYTLIRNMVAVVQRMDSAALDEVESPLFPKEALDFYSRFNLLQLDLSSPDTADQALMAKYYNPARGGAQGDYRDGILPKIDNLVDCLTKFPNSKRAVITIPFSTKPSAQADHTETGEAKCLRELHFYLEEIAGPENTVEKYLCCSGFMRAQAVSIFPKNIHMIGRLMNLVAGRLGWKVGSYTHSVTTLNKER